MNDSIRNVINTLQNCNLRPTADRRARRRDRSVDVTDRNRRSFSGRSRANSLESVLRAGPSNNNTNPILPPNNNNPPLPTTLTMAELPIITQTAQFCGNVPIGHPEKETLESYDVYRWLEDADNRIASKRITSEEAKIREAKLLVSTVCGDAHYALNSKGMLKFKNYEDFKKECRILWRQVEEKDKFSNIIRYLSCKYDGQSMPRMYADIDHNMEVLMDDIEALATFPVGSFEEPPQGNGRLVYMDHMLRYIVYGVVYAILGEEERKAFKRVPLDPKESLAHTLLKIQDNLYERKTKVDVTMTVTDKVNRGSFNNSSRGNKRYTGTTNNTKSSGYRQTSFRGTSAPKRGNYQGPSRYKNSGFQPRTNNTQGGTTTYQPQGGTTTYQSQGARPKTTCATCGYNNHTTAECRRKKCSHCQRLGHLIQDCWYKVTNPPGKTNTNMTNFASQYSGGSVPPPPQHTIPTAPPMPQSIGSAFPQNLTGGSGNPSNIQ